MSVIDIQTGGLQDYDLRLGKALLAICQCGAKVANLLQKAVVSVGASSSKWLMYLSEGEQLIALPTRIRGRIEALRGRTSERLRWTTDACRPSGGRSFIENDGPSAVRTNRPHSCPRKRLRKPCRGRPKCAKSRALKRAELKPQTMASIGTKRFGRR